jgi:hypothetical protein
LAAVVIGYPLYLSWSTFTYYKPTATPSIIDFTIIFHALYLLTWVLLGNNRLRALIAASFAFSIINLAQMPVVYIFLLFIHVNDILSFLEAAFQNPLIYYGGAFFTNVIITVCCLLAARWLRGAMLKPPLKLYVFFNHINISRMVV